MVAAPARYRQPQRRTADAGPRQQAIAAPGQATAEPAQPLVIQLAHGRAAQMLHLQRGNARLRVVQSGWRNLCRLQGSVRHDAALCIRLQYRVHKGHGCYGGVDAGTFRNQQRGTHVAIIATFATSSAP